MNTIYTIGHSTKPFPEFLAKLREHAIDVLVDVRSIPRSRFNPQYNEKRLAESLAVEGIRYLARGANLGGKLENVDYEQAIDELVLLVRSGKNVCVMCSEGDYRTCHRRTMLEPSFRGRGLVVAHLRYGTAAVTEPEQLPFPPSSDSGRTAGDNT